MNTLKLAFKISIFLVYFISGSQSVHHNKMGQKLTASQVIMKLNLTPNPEGGYFVETFRDTSINLTKSQLSTRFKVGRPISTAIYYLLQSGSVSNLHRIPSAETWHFYMGEPLTILEIDDKSGNVKLTCIGQDIEENQQLQYTVPPDVWFGAFPTRDYNILKDNKVTKNKRRDVETYFSLVGTTVAPAFETDDFVLAKRSQLVSRFPALKSIISIITPSD